MSKLNLKTTKFYRYKDLYLPSVTSFLKVKSKGEGFERWLGNHESYATACKQRDDKRDVGLWLHERFPKILNGAEPSRYKKHQGYLQSFAAFRHYYDPISILQEEPIADLKRGYAGTPDILCWLRARSKDGKSITNKRILVLLDYKTAKQIRFDHFLQPASYLFPIKGSTWWKAWRRGRSSIMTGIVRFSEDGSFNPRTDIQFHTLKQARKDFAAAMSLKRVFTWEHRDEMVSRDELKVVAYPINPKIINQ